MSLGLALSGGGAKGAAHIGVLQALKEENIPIDYIAGTSSGSIIATLYAVGYHPYQILEIFKNYCSCVFDCDKKLPFRVLGTMFTGKISIKGLAKGDRLENLVRLYCARKNIHNISQIKLPIAIPTVDLNTGQVVYFVSQKLTEAPSSNFHVPVYITSCDIASVVRASSSFPAVFEPKRIGKYYLMDGGVKMNTPISVLKKMGATKTLAICFDKKEEGRKYTQNMVSIVLRAFDIMGQEVNYTETKLADEVLIPQIEDMGLLDCSRIRQSVNIGYMLVKNNIGNIRCLI